MGWLGWPPTQALAADVNCIMLAMEGKLEMTYPEVKQAKRSTSSCFKDFVKGHNARIQNGE